MIRAAPSSAAASSPRAPATTSYRFGLEMLTQRMARSRNIGHSFDWEHPAFLRPHLPDPREVVSAPCTVGGGDVLDGQDTHASDLAALEQLAELFGVPTHEGRLGDIYTLPDSVRRGLVPIQGR